MILLRLNKGVNLNVPQISDKSNMMLNTDFCSKASSPARQKTEWLWQNNKVTGSVTRHYCQEVRQYQPVPDEHNLGMWRDNIEPSYPHSVLSYYNQTISPVANNFIHNFICLF